MTPKQQIQALLNQLPAEATFEEIQAHLNSYGGRRPSVETSLAPQWGRGGRAQPSSGAEAFAVWQNIVSI